MALSNHLINKINTLDLSNDNKILIRNNLQDYTDYCIDNGLNVNSFRYHNDVFNYCNNTIKNLDYIINLRQFEEIPRSSGYTTSARSALRKWNIFIEEIEEEDETYEEVEDLSEEEIEEPHNFERELYDELLRLDEELERLRNENRILRLQNERLRLQNERLRL